MTTYLQFFTYSGETNFRLPFWGQDGVDVDINTKIGKSNSGSDARSSSFDSLILAVFCTDEDEI